MEKAAMNHRDSLRRKTVVIADDNVIVRHCWKQALHDWKTERYGTPEAFFTAAVHNLDLDGQYACFIIDLHYGIGQMDGVAFAQRLRPRFRGPIFLSSDEKLAALPETIQAQIPKDTMTSDELHKLIQKYCLGEPP